jgi:hypothetical protein
MKLLPYFFAAFWFSFAQESRSETVRLNTSALGFES